MTTSESEPANPAPAPAAPAPAEAPAEPPVPDRFRSNEPAEPGEIHRKLLFGGALVCALVSVYAGLLGWGKVLQYGFAGLAVITVFAALLSGAAALSQQRPGNPPKPGPPGTGA